MQVEVLFSAREYASLPREDLTGTVCVVFDILRATSTIVTALGRGARSIRPVSSIREAVALRASQPALLLGGERDGLRIRADQTGSVDFDFGNSPREYTAERVGGKEIVMTTTNGTRALQAAARARQVLVGAFLNLSALAAKLREQKPARLCLICSGTLDQAAYEDLLAAGGLLDRLWDLYSGGAVADSAQIARQIFLSAGNDLSGALQFSRNGRRLRAIPELQEDVAFCLQLDLFPISPELKADGTVRT